MAATASPTALLPGSPLLEEFSIDQTLGVMFIGNIFVAILFAVTSIQTYIYYRRNATDNMIMKLVVYLLWLLDSLHLCLITYTVYFYTITNFANPTTLFNVHWSLSATMSICGLSDLLVTVVYVIRIWKFCDGTLLAKFIVGAVMLGEMVCIAGDSSINALSLRSPGTYTAYQQKYRWTWYMAFGTRAIVDIIITATIVVVMYKSRSHFKKTNSVIRLIIMYSVNTCALTTLFTLLSVVLYAALPNTFFGFAIAMQLPKLMVNSLMALLNSRQSMRKMCGPQSMPASIHLSQITSLSDRSPRDSGHPELGKKALVHMRPSEDILEQRGDYAPTAFHTKEDRV